MATFSSLLDQKRIIRLTVALKRGQFHDRKFYAFPECLEWMRKEVPKMVTGRIQSPLNPAEQLTERLRQWIAGEPMREGPWFHDMTPKEQGVWEMKTDDLRIFGWMYRRCEFVAVHGGYTDDYKEPTKTKDYAAERRNVENERDNLPLDGDKFVLGDFDDLV